MRIAMIDNARGWGGAERILFLLARGLVDLGHEVTIFLREGAATVPPFRDQFSSVVEIPRHGVKGVRGIIQLVRTARRVGFDLIHVHRNHDLPVGKLASLVSGAPLLLTQHCQLGTTSLPIISMADRIIAVSHFIGDGILERFPSLRGRLDVIHNGIDLRPFVDPRPGYWGNVPAVSGSSPLLGVVGYFYKNQEKLIALMAEVRRHLPAAMLVVIGRDDERLPLLERVVSEHSLSGAVYFAGRIPYEEIPDALSGLDFNASAFLREGCALNVIEALATGTPFIGYRAGSYPELVQDGVTGILADDDEGFVRRLVEVVKQPDILRNMGEEARRDAFERFSLDRMVSQYDVLYRQMGVAR